VFARVVVVLTSPKTSSTVWARTANEPFFPPFFFFIVLLEVTEELIMGSIRAASNGLGFDVD